MLQSSRVSKVLVAGSVFVLFGLLDGIRLTFGIFLLDWTSSFSAGRGQVAWIGAIVYGVSNLAGSCSSAVIRRTGCHVAISLGSSLVAGGLFLSSFATNITFLYLSYGILIGFGYSMAYLGGMVMVSRHFRDRMSLAMGLTISGGGIGVFFANPAIRVLSDQYGWRGALWILSAVLLHGVAIGCITKMASTSLKARSRNSCSQLTTESSIKTDISNNVKDNTVQQSFCENRCESNAIEYVRSCTNGGSQLVEESRPFLCEEHNTRPAIKLIAPQDRDRIQCPDAQTHGVAIEVIKVDGDILIQAETYSRRCCNGASDNSANVDNSMQNIERIGSSKQTEEFATHVHIEESLFLKRSEVHQRKYWSSKEQCHDRCKLSQRQFCERTTSVMRSYLCTCARILWPSHIMKNKIICIFLIGSFLRSFPFFIPVTYLQDIIVHAGFSPLQAAWVASISGVSNTVCVLVVGWLADLRCVNRIMLFSVCIVVSGLLTSFCYLYKTLELLITYAVVFSFFFSGHTVLTAVVVTDICSTRLFPDTLGYQWTIMGIGAMLGTPLAGLIFDVKQDYDLAFAASGAAILLSGLITGTMLLIKPDKSKNYDPD